MSTKFLSNRLTFLVTGCLLLLSLTSVAAPVIGHGRELNGDDGSAQFGFIASETRIGNVEKGDEQGRFDPQHSSASCCNTTEVEIWVNVTGFKSGQIKLAYNSTCADVTDWVANTTHFPLATWDSATPGEE
ncbi:MAG: hypothetical protein WBW48_06045, partial [Anaerolineae bacterium]